MLAFDRIGRRLCFVVREQVFGECLIVAGFFVSLGGGQTKLQNILPIAPNDVS
jgi:hypothetical protein